ncbi:MAG: PilZ domain-containing protein [Magnetococcales bacterium]|nr:PilZ domain-containing protein [Magnetococcales bacterium]
METAATTLPMGEPFSENQLFRHYGRLTLNCFSEHSPPGTPVSVFPKGISGVKTGSTLDGHHTGHLEVYADKEQLSFVQKAVDRLREGLLNEANQAPGRANRSTILKLDEFKNALESGREAMMNENPFYELTGLIFRLNQTALKNAFVADQVDADRQLPGSIKVARSLMHLWGRDGAMISTREKVRETLGKVVSVGKIAVGVLLFLGSSLTTAKAIADVMQEPRFIALFGSGFSGAEHESARWFAAIMVGLVFSSIILDFKDRMFQGVAEAGRVFKGIFQSFQRFPRWMLLSLFLTAFSIWTNYDGIVLLFSKTQDLSYQWRLIEKNVLEALGDPGHGNGDNPSSLADLSAVLDKTVADIAARFDRIPEDEMSGAASSGKAEKGPRYWAKYFIVHGGYVPGERDVTHAYKPTSAAAGIDQLLVDARFDLKTPLRDKLKVVAAEFVKKLEENRLDVLEDMKNLGGRMVLKNYSLAELQTLFQLEAYHVNESVKAVVAKLEVGTTAFAAVVREMEKVTTEHVDLLRKVDQYGIATNTQYKIDIQVAIPRVEAIERLKQGGIPEAKRRSLEELRQFLFTVYGVFFGMVILGLILFVSVFMDLSDPILYSAMVARWGRRDRHFLDDNQQSLQQWEEGFVRRLRSFFVRPEIRPLMPSISCPGNMIFAHVFHYYLEEIHPHTKDPASRTIMEKFRFWFADLFSNTRMVGVLGYNSRQGAIRKFIKNKEVCAPQFINRIFPGFLDPFTPGSSHFDTLRERIVRAQAGLEARFQEELASIGQAIAQSEADRIPLSSLGLDTKDSVVSPRTGAASWIRKALLGSFLAPPAPCPLTRLRWLERIWSQRSQGESSQYHLASFAPIIMDWLSVSKFPALHESTIVPMEGLLQSIPNRRMLEDALELHAAYAEMEGLRQALTEILGLSMFHGDMLDKGTLHSILNATGFPEMGEIFLFQRQEIHVLEKRLEGIRVHLDSTHKVLRALVDNQDAIVEVLTRIRTHHLSPMHVILERMENRPFFEKSLRLDVLFRDLINMERFMIRLWDANADGGDAAVLEVESATGAGERESEANPMLRYLICDRGESQWTLLETMAQLEQHADETHKKLNAIVFVLTFVDKLAVKVRGQLEEILDIQQQVIARDRRHKVEMLGGVGIADRKILDFMDNNRLFFMSLPSRVNTIFEKIDLLLQDPGVAEPHNVELFRGVEARVFKLNQFMKHTLEFFDGRRERLELPPSLSFSGPVSADIAGELSGDPLAGIEALSGDLNSTDAILLILKKARSALREISLVEWDLLKLPIPPQIVMEIFEENKGFIENAWVEVERLQAAIDSGATATDPLDYASLADQGRVLLQALEGILKRVDVFPVVDRRMANEYALVDASAGRRAADKGQDSRCPAPVKPSRRSMERVVAFHPVELRFSGVGIIQGVLRDVSKTGACIECDAMPPPILKQETEGTIRLLADKQGNKMSCRVQRLTGRMIGLKIDESNQAGFAQVIRREVTGGRPAIV